MLRALSLFENRAHLKEVIVEEFYDRIGEELSSEYREKDVIKFIEERMQSFYLENPNVISPAIECSNHANKLLRISPSCALVMYTTAIELYLKSVLLKPVLFGMIHNKNIADLIVESSVGQTGFSRYNNLLKELCIHAAGIDLDSIKGMQNKPILKEAEQAQKIRNKVVHQGYKATIEQMGMAKNIAYLMLTDVVEPVLNNLDLVITSNNMGFCVAKA